MKINLVIKKAECNSFHEIRETLENLIPEELGFELPSLEDFEDEYDWETDRLYRAAPYGSLLIVKSDGDYEITVDLTQEFATDTLRLVNKIIRAASGIIGAVVSFAGTFMVLGRKFISKAGDLCAEFSKKWFAPVPAEPETAPAPAEPETTENSEEKKQDEEKYGVYPLKFLWDNNDGNARWGVVTVIVEKCDYIHSGFRVIDKKANVSFNSNFEATYEKAECQLFMDLVKYGFEPMFSDFNEARLEMLNKFDEMIRRTPPEKPDDAEELDQMLQTTFDDSEDEISMDELEKACEKDEE